MRVGIEDKGPLAVDRPHVNGRSQAETEILKLVQTNYFDKEIKILKDFQTKAKDRHHDKEKKVVLKIK